jgi:CLIP-associating protein 1/2
VVAQGTPLKAVDSNNRVIELQGYISALAEGDPGVHVLQKLALLCIENPVAESASPPPSPSFGFPSSPSPFIAPSRSLPSMQAEIWDKDKNFERLFNALVQFLEPSKVRRPFDFTPIMLIFCLDRRRA